MVGWIGCILHNTRGCLGAANKDIDSMDGNSLPMIFDAHFTMACSRHFSSRLVLPNPTIIEKGENAFNDSAAKSYHDILPNTESSELSKKQQASLFMFVMHRIFVPQLNFVRTCCSQESKGLELNAIY